MRFHEAQHLTVTMAPLLIQTVAGPEGASEAEGRLLGHGTSGTHCIDSDIDCVYTLGVCTLKKWKKFVPKELLADPTTRSDAWEIED